MGNGIQFMRTLKLILVAVAGYLLFQVVEGYLDTHSKPKSQRKPVKTVGDQVGGAVLTGGGAGRVTKTNGHGGQRTATVTGRGVVRPGT
jgi:hypothetical protein